MKILLSCMIASCVALGVASASASAQPSSSRVLAIVAPYEARMNFDESGAVEISFAADPPLGEGDRIVVRVDDQVVVLPPGATKAALTGIPLGTHVLEALIVDTDDNPVAAAVSVVFYMGGGFTRI